MYSTAVWCVPRMACMWVTVLACQGRPVHGAYWISTPGRHALLRRFMGTHDQSFTTQLPAYAVSVVQAVVACTYMVRHRGQ